MATPTHASVAVHVDLPADVPGVSEQAPEDLAADLKFLWILDQVRLHRVSVGRGAELAQLDRVSFSQRMAEHGIPVFDIEPEDLAAELDTLERTASPR